MPTSNAFPAVDHVRFGRFMLVPSTRRLEKDGVAVSLGGRAIDILTILVDRAGEIVSHNELLERVWPTVQVDPSGLRVQMTALRKVLTDGDKSEQVIANIAGRGYCFVAPVVWAIREQPRSVQDAKAALPRLMPLLGRDDTVTTVIRRLVEERFVTIAGPGGVGKTAVAAAVAHALLPAFDGEVYFIDLSEVTSSLAAQVMIGTTVLRIFVRSDGAPKAIADALEFKRVLIVLDCCDHVAREMGELGTLIIETGKNCNVLATSREELLAQDGATLFLSPLDYPPDDLNLSTQQLGTYPSVRLLSDLVVRSSEAFPFDDKNLRAMARMARQLDGLPLALEIAAASIAHVGIEPTASMISSHLGLFLANPDAAPRHQSLTATLDWSYSQLTPDQRLILQSLSVFAGPFSMDGIQSVAGGPDIDAGAATTGVLALHAKSWLYRESNSELCGYRMLDTTRSFALSKLMTSGDGEVVKRRHARYFARHLADANAATRGLTTRRPVKGLASNIHNIRAALAWCFSASGDTVIGAELAAASSHLFAYLQLHAEGINWTTRALAALRLDLVGTELELGLRVGILSNAGYEAQYVDLLATQLPAIIALADKWGSEIWRVEARAWDCMLRAQIRNITETIECALAVRGIALSHEDYPNRLLADWLLGFAYHLSGDLCKVGPLCVSATTLSLSGENIFYSGAQSAAHLCAVGSFTRTLWLQGRPKPALRIARTAMARTSAMRLQPESLTFFLPLLIWAGAWTEADDLIAEFAINATAPDFGGVAVLSYRGQLELRRGDLEAAVPTLQRAASSFPVYAAPGEVLANLAEALALSGQYDHAREAIDLAFVSDEEIGETFYRPELLRVRGVVMAVGPASESPSAEIWFRRAAACAKKQGSLSFELRATISLARWYHDAGRSAHAHAILADVYERFTEGFDTPDLFTAEALLREIDPARSEASTPVKQCQGQ